MSTIPAIIHQGISPSTCLRIWGEIRNRDKVILPNGLGWPGASVEYRLMKFGHGAKEQGRKPFLTGPEAAIDRLEADRAIAHWTQAMLAECTAQQRVATHLFFVTGKCWAEIAARMSETEKVTADDVGNMIKAVRRRIGRAIDSARLEKVA